MYNMLLVMLAVLPHNMDDGVCLCHHLSRYGVYKTEPWDNVAKGWELVALSILNTQR